MRRPAAAGAGLLLLASLAASCRPPAERWSTVDRLVADEPPDRLTEARLGDERQVAAWSLPELLERSSPLVRTDPAPDSLTPRYARFATRKVTVELDLATPLAAGEVDAVEIEVGHFGPGEAVLEWGAPDESMGEPPGGARRAAVPTGTSGGRAKLAAHRFRLAGHPRWRGAVGRLRLTVTLERGGRIDLGRIAAFRRQVDAERVAAVLAGAWKVDLGGELREARPAAAGRPVTWRTAAPAGARLRLGYGVWPASQRPVRFTVRARSGSGSTEEVVLDDTVPPGGVSSGEPGGWREATVELPGPAGEVELSFDTTAAGPPESAFAVWSSPELLAPASSAGAAGGAAGASTAAAGSTAPGSAPDVVLISVDTLRADHLSLYGYRRDTSPAIDAWAAGRSAVFERAVVQATWTLPSHTSMLTGVEAYRHGVNFNRPAPRRLVTLAERLRGAGYRTVAITGGGFVHPEFGLGQGFERFAYWPSWRQVADELPEHLERALALLSEPAGRPLFLFFHTYEVHHSSIPRRPEIWRFGKLGPLARLTIERQPETAENGFQMAKRWGIEHPEGRPELPPEVGGFPADVYDSRIAFMDRHVGRLLETLAGRSRPTVVVLTSDHGELLGEDGLAGHYSLHDGNSYVPLVLSAPSMPPGERRFGCQVRSIDLVPTLVELVGLPAPSGIDGGSLVPVLEEGCGRAPRRAVTYGANGNRGVGLRVADRFAVEVNDAVWPPLAGHRLVRPLHPEAEGGGVPPDAEVDGLVAGLGRAFLDAVPGLRLRFDNPGPEPLAGAIEGPPVGTANLKSFDLPGPVIEYGGKGVARFTVPPGATYHLIVEDPGDRWLRIRIESPGPPAAERIELAEIDEASRPLRLTPGAGGRWARATGPAPTTARPSILIWRVGRPGEGDAPPEETDPELRKRLEALGYL